MNSRRLILPGPRRLAQKLDPRGADLRHALARAGGIVDESQCSPVSRLPLGCCRIRSTPIMLEKLR
jgi:hypothetical protein